MQVVERSDRLGKRACSRDPIRKAGEQCVQHGLVGDGVGLGRPVPEHREQDVADLRRLDAVAVEPLLQGLKSHRDVRHRRR